MDGLGMIIHMKHDVMVGYIYWHEIGMQDNIMLVGET